MIDKKILNTEIKNWKKTKEWSQILQIYLNEIIEVCVSEVGDDLDREDATQELWLFIIKTLPKVNTKKNSYAYIQTSVRHFISDIREKVIRHNHVNMEDIPEV